MLFGLHLPRLSLMKKKQQVYSTRPDGSAGRITDSNRLVTVRVVKSMIVRISNKKGGIYIVRIQNASALNSAHWAWAQYWIQKEVKVRIADVAGPVGGRARKEQNLQVKASEINKYNMSNYYLTFDVAFDSLEGGQKGQKPSVNFVKAYERLSADRPSFSR